MRNICGRHAGIYAGYRTRTMWLSYGEYVMVIMWELQVVIVQEYGGYHMKPSWICIHHVYMSNAWI